MSSRRVTTPANRPISTLQSCGISRGLISTNINVQTIGSIKSFSRERKESQASREKKELEDDLVPLEEEKLVFSLTEKNAPQSKKEYLIGTSGYSYDMWSKKVIPPNMRDQVHNFYTSTNILKEYCARFKAVEIGCTRYRKLTPSQCASWFTSTPNDFVFSIKMPLYITHYKKLNDFESWWQQEFYPAIQPLKHKLGVLLFEFADMRYTPANVDKLLQVKSIIPPEIRCAFEFRLREWYSPEAVAGSRDLFTGNWGYVTNFVTNGGTANTNVGDLRDGVTEPSNPPSGGLLFTYLRLHGSKGFCEGTYGAEYLIREVYSRCSAKINFVFFNNVDSWEPFSLDEPEVEAFPVNSMWPLSHYTKKVGSVMTPSAVLDAWLLSRLV
jgi:uncharacterized protein YecE (DUF72 family)